MTWKLSSLNLGYASTRCCTPISSKKHFDLFNFLKIFTAMIQWFCPGFAINLHRHYHQIREQDGGYDPPSDWWFCYCWNIISPIHISFSLPKLSLQPFLSLISLLGMCNGYSSCPELAIDDSIDLQRFADNKAKEIDKYSQHSTTTIDRSERTIHYDNIVIEEYSIHKHYENITPQRQSLWKKTREWWLFTIGIIGIFVWISTNWNWLVSLLPKVIRKKIKKWMKNKMSVL